MDERRGIVLAGGLSTRLYPVTAVVCKQALPVYDKPMIYYAISTLMLAGIREILIISSPRDLQLFQAMLGDGARWGVSFQYALQPRPEGVAQALIIGREFIGSRPVALILGDNLFYGQTLRQSLRQASQQQSGATIFGHFVKEPERYGVVSFDAGKRPIRIEEKPAKPDSSCAVVGLYFYDRHAADIASGLEPSARHELEITDVNNAYLARGQLTVEMLGRGTVWLDMGTFPSLLQASNFVHTVEERQGLKIACPEEIAYREGWIPASQLEALAAGMHNSAYGEYLMALCRGI